MFIFVNNILCAVSDCNQVKNRKKPVTIEIINNVHLLLFRYIVFDV